MLVVKLLLTIQAVSIILLAFRVINIENQLNEQVTECKQTEQTITLSNKINETLYHG